MEEIEAPAKEAGHRFLPPTNRNQKPFQVPGTLRGHWINGLVTDETFAQMILETAG
jgi:hypothetical protein